MTHSPLAHCQLPFQTRAILFDLDDTLYSRAEAFQSWLPGFIHHHNLATDPTHEQKVFTQLLELDRRCTTRLEFFARICELYPDLQCTEGELLAGFYAEFRYHIMEDTGMLLLIQALKDADIPFGIVTNGSMHQQKKIIHLGLDTLTSCIFISEAFGEKKPAPGIFLAAARCLEIPPAQILFDGDNARADIAGAHAVGMKTAWLPGNHSWPDDLNPNIANAVLYSSRELCTLCGVTIPA